jgi:hypothetical protein
MGEFDEKIQYRIQSIQSACLLLMQTVTQQRLVLVANSIGVFKAKLIVEQFESIDYY